MIEMMNVNKMQKKIEEYKLSDAPIEVKMEAIEKLQSILNAVAVDGELDNLTGEDVLCK